MPRLVQVSAYSTTLRKFIAIDREGEVWRGETKKEGKSGQEYIEWKRIPSEFIER
jgi:hypothetical protein